ncbi:MAG: sulfite exporter TauE/SafE [Rhodothermales bacterium]|jgi:sulfite exporter TauE/SafE
MMPPLVDIASLFLMGLFGSAHCLGMCGGFSLLAGRSGWWPGYALGKTLTYSLMGVAGGLVGHLVIRTAPVQQAVSILVGVVLIVLGAATAGLIPDRFAGISGLTNWIGPRLGSAMASGRRWGSIGVGALNGLLPCGLVYAALLLSVDSGSAVGGGVMMAVFGLATLPALALAGVIGQRLTPDRRVGLVRAGGLLVIAMGLLAIWRAFMMMPGGH